MKKLSISVIALAMVFYGCGNTKNEDIPAFSMNVEIHGVADSTLIYLQKVDKNNLRTVDSSYLKDSRAYFAGSLQHPEMLYIKIGQTGKLVNIFGENTSIAVNVHADSLEGAKVKGSKTHDDMLAFKMYLEPLEKKLQLLGEQFRIASAEGNSGRMEELSDRYEALRAEQINTIVEFVKSKADSYISPFIINRYLAYDMDYVELDSLLTNLEEKVQNSRDYKMLSKRVATLKKVAVGQEAVDFALSDTTGNPIAISSFRGKILLIDFWASWCGPCRRENPNVVRLYNDFNDRGFEIIGVSFDENRDRWIEAIHQDGLVWNHVSDLKGWASEAGKLYAISSIPATVLVDREGKIVAKNLRGKELRKKLEELYSIENQNS